MDSAVLKLGNIVVTDKIFKTARRTYKISHIERIHLKRPWFLFGLPLSIGSFFLLSMYGDYLYPIESVLCLFTMLVLPIILFFVGTLSITSKALTNDNAITGFMPTLKQTRNALEEVLYNNHTKDSIVNQDVY